MESEEAPVQDEQYFDELPFGGYDFVFVDEPSPGQTCSICLTASYEEPSADILWPSLLRRMLSRDIQVAYHDYF